MKVSIVAVVPVVLCAVLAALLPGGIEGHAGHPHIPSTLAAAVTARKDLSLLAQGLTTYPAAFQAAISDPNIAVTVFAPTNKAISALLTKLKLASWPAATSDGAALAIAVLKYHIVPVVAFSSHVKHNTTVPTLLTGGTLLLDTKAGKSIIVRGAYSDALVIKANIRAAKSVIHIIDDVLLPAYPLPAAFPSIAAAAAAVPDLSILLSAVKAANLAGTLSNSSLAVTVFAPTNKAFANFLAKYKFPSLASIPVPVLTKVLLYHVVPAVKPASTLLANARVPTLLDGQSLKFEYRVTRRGPAQPPVVIRAAKSKANVLIADVFSGTGVVHVVDTVLFPNL